MEPRPTFTTEEAAKFLKDHELTFLDLCELVLSVARETDGMIKWTHPRCVVHIKQAPRKKKVQGRKG